MHLWTTLSLLVLLAYAILPFPNKGCSAKCDKSNRRLKFHLIKPFHRSLEEKLHVENVDSLESCKQMAIAYKGLALNYSPRNRFSLYKDDINPKISRDDYWEQPQLYFNCHILQCPETLKSKSLINDSLFDYYSLYEMPIAIPNQVCIPQIGIFIFHTTTTETFQNASKHCQHYMSKDDTNYQSHHCGNLAHIASVKRSTALANIIKEYNEQQTQLNLKPKIYLAYVGLVYNRTRSQRFQMFNMDDESLECYNYRAWEPGNPIMKAELRNSSCVALTTHGTWRTVDCRRKLSFFCEILTECFDN